jgi:hypothetical protein
MTLKKQMRTNKSNDGTRQWTISTLRNSIPSLLLRLYYYVRFLERLAMTIRELAAAILEQETIYRLDYTAAKLRELYQPYLSQTEKKSQVDKVGFLIHQNISDLEEVVRGLFGQNQFVIPGYGSKEGLSVLKDIHLNTHEEKLQDMTANIKRRGDLELSCLGLIRLDETTVVNKLNGRVVDMKEAEHGSCNGYKFLNKAKGNMSASKPRVFERHCWPSKADCTGLFTEVVDHIMSDKIESYQKLCKSGMWSPVSAEYRHPSEPKPHLLWTCVQHSH